MACYSIYFCVVCLTVCMFPCITCIIKNVYSFDMLRDTGLSLSVLAARYWDINK